LAKKKLANVLEGGTLSTEESRGKRAFFLDFQKVHIDDELRGDRKNRDGGRKNAKKRRKS